MSQEYAVTGGETDVVEEWEPGIWSRLLAETFGSFLLVLGIVGTSLYNIVNQGSILTVALAGGIAWIAASAAVGRISGGHFNPAVSFGAAFAGRLAWRDLGPYVLAQLVGAVLSAAVVFATIPQTLVDLTQKADKFDFFQDTANGFSINSPMYTSSGGGAQFDLFPTLLIEVIVTAVFVGVVLGVSDKRAKVTFAPVVTGLLVTGLTIVTWIVDGGAFNPARSTATALFSNDWSANGVGGQLWLFWVAPLVGAALAALFYRAFASEPYEFEDVEADPVVATAPADDDEEWTDIAATEAKAEEKPLVTAQSLPAEKAEVVEPEADEEPTAETEGKKKA